MQSDLLELLLLDWHGVLRVLHLQAGILLATAELCFNIRSFISAAMDLAIAIPATVHPILSMQLSPP